MILVDPVDKSPLIHEGDELVSASRRYPIIEGVPVLLVKETEQTHGAAKATIELDRTDPLFLETIGIEPEQRVALRTFSGNRDIDPVVQFIIVHTNGRLYESLVGNLREYPIPDIRLPEGDGRALLDIGSNWGRWSIAAARKGYKVTAIDPSLGAVLAGRRVAKQLGVNIDFIVADARFLPFPSATFDVCFSYGVLQHFSRENAASALREIGRVLVPGGESHVQMPNARGAVCLYHQARRGFRDGTGFNVRYWKPLELLRLFSSCIGPSSLSVDGFFGLGVQAADIRLMPRTFKVVIRISEFLRSLSAKLRPLMSVADSLYVHSQKHQ
jgi:SAM-dependent methyltransferase/uncharacterized protein YbaR (Trm112 family)